jgi:hypothetical protein
MFQILSLLNAILDGLRYTPGGKVGAADGKIVGRGFSKHGSLSKSLNSKERELWESFAQHGRLDTQVLRRSEH